ncbi:hypothetical protein BDF20DRAFT_838562 [Mycotypha africana]|uniref:uncharacterized protein n=1 Tax=Mycotypha africana TaxID=64632 RepID=UPI002300C894|nr:uncharacterized protein BDF20DRAFT_838562 [Mycotypha africana]KAI8970182.1 hypothetical protein BDF20DRAFT_838562 [Mycotypha africana]
MPISLKQQGLLSSAVQTIDLLQSIFFNKDEFHFAEEKEERLFQQLKSWDETGDWPDNNTDISRATKLQFFIKAPVDVDSCVKAAPSFITLHCTLSLVSLTDYQLTLPSAANDWLSRDDHQAMSEELSNYVVDEPMEDRSTWIVEKIQHVQQIAETYIEKWSNDRKEKEKQAAATNKSGPMRFLREWIWFPMIYTKNKRGDIIDWAPQYKITGFLCPGKPGALCLEGPDKKVSQFINDIKTISWANIPPSHKKMTSRWKETVEDCQNEEELDSHRIFPDMQEVKFDIHGQFANHNNLSMLQTWMKEKGCGEAFERLFEYDS